MAEIRVVVAIDFGTTFSGFSCAHINGEIETHDNWTDNFSYFEYKVPTILLYDKEWNVISWGPASTGDRGRKAKGKQKETEEKKTLAQHFKLHIGVGPTNEKHCLPDGLNYKKATIDYLRRLKSEIVSKVETRWPGVQFPQSIRFIVTVPTEWDPESTNTMRECIFEAGITDSKWSRNLQFTSEPEAAALHCLDCDEQYDLNVGDMFMVADCGGGTVDITTRKILKVLSNNKRLSEMTEGIGAACGSTFVDREFIRFLGEKLGIGDSEMEEVQKNHSIEFYNLIQTTFCPLKYVFNHDASQFDTFHFDIEIEAGFLKKYARDKYEMEENEWTIPIYYTDVKKMFDDPVSKIVNMIRSQLRGCEQKCKAMFLVGGFSESPYLQEAIKDAFADGKIEIPIPLNPIAAVCRGGARYGLTLENDLKSENFGLSKMIASRVLQYTYGLAILRDWEEGDPEDKIIFHNYVRHFFVLAKRGDNITVGHEVIETFAPIFPFQTEATTNIYISRSKDPKWPDEEGVKCLTDFEPIEIPIPENRQPIETLFGNRRPIEIKIEFISPSEIKQTSRIVDTGTIYTKIVKLPESLAASTFDF